MSTLGYVFNANGNYIETVLLNLNIEYHRDILQFALKRYYEGKLYTHMVFQKRVIRLHNKLVYLDYKNYQSRLMREFAHDYRKES